MLNKEGVRTIICYTREGSGTIYVKQRRDPDQYILYKGEV